MSFLVEIERLSLEAEEDAPAPTLAEETPDEPVPAPEEEVPAPEEAPRKGKRRKHRGRKTGHQKTPERTEDRLQSILAPEAVPAPEESVEEVPVEAQTVSKPVAEADQEWHAPMVQLPEPGTYEVDETTGLPMGKAQLLDEEFKQKLKQIESGEEAAGPSRRRRRRFRGGSKQLVGWDLDPRFWNRGQKAGRNFMFISVGLLCLASLTLAIFLFTTASRTGKQRGTQEVAVPALRPDSPLPVDERQMRTLVLRDPKAVITRLEPTIRKFLEAKDWQERLTCCREADRVRPLMETYYKKEADGPVNFRSIGGAGDEIAYLAGVAAVRIEMADYSVRQIAVYIGKTTIEIDWESWVGYCEMSPDDFRASRTTQARLMRVDAKRADPPYINYLFRDEENLDCFLLVFHDETSVFGYTPRFSKESIRMRELVGLGSRRLMVKLAFPENSPTSNQVWIREVVDEGWVLGLSAGIELKPEGSGKEDQ